MPQVKYWRAISDALKEERERDETVCLFGEDVGEAGGAFGASRGLQQRFGKLRVRDTPISEEAIMGCAVGAAITGLRPVAEIMFFDFIGLAMDQLVNNAAKLSFMSAGKLAVPLTVITQCAVGRNSGPQHTSSLEAWPAHVPGLKVVWAATPYDAKGLLKSAIRDDNPVIFVSTLMNWTQRGEVPAEEYTVPIGVADVKRPGKDLTIVTVGSALGKVLEAAKRLEGDGVDAEVIDLRAVSPLDVATVTASVARTRRAMVVHDAVLPFGIGGEVSARLHEELFGVLKAPVARLGAAFSPSPFSPELGKGYLPQVEA